jgi:hypothetical protein
MHVSFQMLSKSEGEQLVTDAHRYKLKRHDWIYLELYKEFVWAHGVRRRALELLGPMVKEAKEDLKLQQGSMVKEEQQQVKQHP